MLLKINTKGFRRANQALGELEKAFRTVTSDPRFLNDVGLLLTSRAKQNLEDGGEGGRSYVLLKPATRREKSRKGYSLKPIQRSGLMRRSLSSEVESGKLYLTGLKIVRHHHYGAPRAGIPERKVFTVEGDDLEDIKDFLIRRFNQLNPNLK